MWTIFVAKGQKNFRLKKKRKSPYSQFASPANQELFEHQRSQQEPSSVRNMINIKLHLILLWVINLHYYTMTRHISPWTIYLTKTTAFNSKSSNNSQYCYCNIHLTVLAKRSMHSLWFNKQNQVLHLKLPDEHQFKSPRASCKKRFQNNKSA